MGWVGADVLGRPQPLPNAISFDRGRGRPEVGPYLRSVLN